ncbi:hypothetical protein [Ureibacillus sinduriensis]|uniref:Uncharacterized protein n=1 Tax=Ureibacillus sinduriensis BLB-1 = JCM 15800 TaxID=1384057 RepID=A0A0A3IGE8_9BACL|nr:hypothetical protein [Ureibacillus sinduriensis]KGR73917.1 hypothetical protein CD33_18065 [Ureibacillus sinduriensis BLB-1 = JCM 15800]
MFGSIFYNFWAAILGFSIYFFSTLTDSTIPLNSLVGSFIAAVCSFLVMYAIRLLLGYIFYTPKDELFKGLNKENEQIRQQMEARMNAEASASGGSNSTLEFKDQSSEEIAKVVQTMMLQDESIKK